jgi:hypothetical protein
LVTDLIITSWGEKIRQQDVALFQWVRGFRGLTCDFWGGKWAYFFGWVGDGLESIVWRTERAYPRAEAPLLWWVERPKAEALAYLEAR